MLHSVFTVAPFEQSPYAYRSGIVEIKAHMDFSTNFLSYSLMKGYIKNSENPESQEYSERKEIENFLWAFKDFFTCKREVNAYCCGKTFVHKTRSCRTYGVVIEGQIFKYNVRIDKNTDWNAVNLYIVVNEKVTVAVA